MPLSEQYSFPIVSQNNWYILRFSFIYKSPTLYFTSQVLILFLRTSPHVNLSSSTLIYVSYLIVSQVPRDGNFYSFLLTLQPPAKTLSWCPTSSHECLINSVLWGYNSHFLLQN